MTTTTQTIEAAWAALTEHGWDTDYIAGSQSRPPSPKRILQGEREGKA